MSDDNTAIWLNMYYWWECSNCYYVNDVLAWDFCPKCGKTMRNGNISKQRLQAYLNRLKREEEETSNG